MHDQHIHVLKGFDANDDINLINFNFWKEFVSLIGVEYMVVNHEKWFCHYAMVVHA